MSSNCPDCGTTLTRVGRITGTCSQCGEVFLSMVLTAEQEQREYDRLLDALIAAVEGKGPKAVMEILSQ